MSCSFPSVGEVTRLCIRNEDVFHNDGLYRHYDRAIAQAVTCCLPTTASRIRLCGIYGG
jgi:hypothetical protein